MSSLSTTDRLKQLLPQLFGERQQRQGDYYLRFQLTDKITALIDLSYVQESIIVDSTQITLVPNLPEYVMGLMSSQNQVFLALDLAHLAGFAPETINQREYNIVVAKVALEQNNLPTDGFDLYGLTVKRILGVSRILPEQFDSSMVSVPEILRPFVRGSIKESQVGSEELQSWLLIDLAQLVANQVKS